MWNLFSNFQNWSDITKSYKDLVDQYKEFGVDVVNIKQELQFYISVIPLVFLAGALVHLYFFRKAHNKIAKLEGQKETMEKQLKFLRDLLEKRIDGKAQQLREQNDQKTQQQLHKKAIQELNNEGRLEADEVLQQKQKEKLQ